MSQNEQVHSEEKEPLSQITEETSSTDEIPSEIESDAMPATVQAAQKPEEQDKAEEYLNLLRRTQADFVNYRRRTNQEMAEVRVTAQMELLDRLLPVFDDLGRAFGTIPPELASDSWVQGLFLVARRLTTLFEQLGIRQTGMAGEKFDPHWHEALMVEPRADVPEGSILQVARPGYALGERVIRPAQVVVAGPQVIESDLPAQQENAAG